MGWSRRVEAFFGEDAVAHRDKREKVPNQYWLQALDHALVAGMHKPLGTFVAQAPVRPLQQGEKREYIESLGALPPELAGHSRQRSCIANSITGS